MARYAVVNSTTRQVVNVIEWTNGNPWTPPQGHELVLAPQGCDIGATESSGTFTPPVPPTPPFECPVWPVGSVFISVVSTNPALLLGCGTWQAIATGRMLVGFDAGDSDFNAAEKTGGAKTHVLQVSEMPSHTHVQNPHNHTQDPHSHGLAEGTTDGSGTFMDRSNAAAATTATTDAATATNQATTATCQNTGGGAAHNNMPPFFAVYMWKRTA